MNKKQSNLPFKDKIRKINPFSPESDIICKAADIVQQGGVIAFPTRCLYGLGADAFNYDAVQKIFEIKQRSSNKPLLVLIKERTELSDLAVDISPVARLLMDHFWPGKLTLVFKAKNRLPANLTAGTGKIGVRMAQHLVPLAILNKLNTPITGTSANISQHKACSMISQMDYKISMQLDLILDAGVLKGGVGSTIVDVTQKKPLILREGEISKKNIFKVIK